ncbi:hypothetical protein P43SY_001095 [Pythium insidiosum]|uniref:Restriction endonuclease domain-containing protein n=1 Tax=Pythium insidiosum TaxID=114742 RepID=A0AAD5LC39_PYTIN|nr:hypothetical protein P43SY_001095 [Pythium insidiosum]
MPPPSLSPCSSSSLDSDDERDLVHDPEALARLVADLRTNRYLCHQDNYPGVTVDDLNAYVTGNGPIYNPSFGSQCAFDVQDGFFDPCKEIDAKMVQVIECIQAQMRHWARISRFRGHVGGPSVGYSLDRTPVRRGGLERWDVLVRFPDVAYVTRWQHRSMSQEQMWSYCGAPFAPWVVANVDALSGPESRLAALDRQMRAEYLAHGVMMGWLIDPRPGRRQMIVYWRGARGQITRDPDTSWRNLDGGDVLPGFELSAGRLESVFEE